MIEYTIKNINFKRVYSRDKCNRVKYLSGISKGRKIKIMPKEGKFFILVEYKKEIIFESQLLNSEEICLKYIYENPNLFCYNSK